MTDKSAIEKAFGGRLALSLSGGGGRAVGYHMGTMAYMDRLGLLEETSILSTVSGGTLIGSGYALSLKKGQRFPEFFHDMYRFLAANEVRDVALHEMGYEHSPPSGRRNAVTALANAYNELFFKDQRFGVFWDGPKIHLRDIIFNATEFKTGDAFRFQKSDAKCFIGNDAIWIEPEHAKLIRMSDIMAASSCIPGGMEPMFFPPDFHWPQAPGGPDTLAAVERSLSERFGVTAVTLMDGGVYDNQGIASVLLALNLRDDPAATDDDDDGPRPMGGRTSVHRARSLLDLLGGDPPDASEVDPTEDGGESAPTLKMPPVVDSAELGLFVISDTPLRDDPIYAPRAPRPEGAWTLKGLSYLALFLALLATASALSVTWHFFVDDPTEWQRAWAWSDLDDILAFLIPAGLTAFVAWALFKARATIIRLLNSIPPAYGPGGRPTPPTTIRHWLRRISLSDILDMIVLRLTSTFALTNDIFMNRIRELGYALIDTQPALKKKIIPNEIFSLLETGFDRDLPPWLQPSKQMTDVVVQQAATMGTKIWWSPPDPAQRGDVDLLLACGSVTICYNVMAHLWRRFPRCAGSAVPLSTASGVREQFADPVVEALFVKAEKDWVRLCQNAYVLVDEWKPAAVAS